MKVHKVTFSNNYANGSSSDRMKKALILNENLFSKLYESFENTDYVNIRSIEKMYRELLPEKVYLAIKKLNQNEQKGCTGGLVTYFYKNKSSNYRIAIISKNNKLFIANLPTFMHESMHLLERLFNPKYNKLEEKVIENSLNKEKTRLLSDYYYNNKHYADKLTNKIFLIKTKMATNKAIKNLAPENKILLLHSLRNSIKSEIEAFNETTKYAIKLKENNRQYKNIDVNKYYKSYMFEQKLDIINSILKKIIKKERCKNVQ